jgi:hypothetical protein
MDTTARLSGMELPDQTADSRDVAPAAPRVRRPDLAKCRCGALWAALAYNLLHFAPVLPAG